MNHATKIVALAVAGVFVAGCSSLDANYKARMDTQLAIERAYAEVEKQKALAEQARFTAMARIGETGDQTAKAVAVMALAMGAAGGKSDQPRVPQPLPHYESEGDKALKWAAILMPSVTNLGAGYFGYRLGVTQSNNNAATTIAGYNSFSNIASSGFNATTATATAGFNTAGQLGSYIQAPQPNITIGGNGVIGSGTMSTALTLSGTGVLGSGTYTGPVTRNCNGGNGAAGGSGAVGGPGGGVGNDGTSNGGLGGNGGAAAPGGTATC